MEILRTDRLLLREFEERDAPGFFALNADPEVLRYTGDSPFDTEAASLELIRNYHWYSTHGYGRWTMERLSDGEQIGWCGLRLQPEGDVDLGYRLHHRHWGQGYATEAAQACVVHGFERLGLAEIIGRVDPANFASARVLEKVGMSFWKEIPDAHNGRSGCTHVYRIQRGVV
ncbi:MAG TPA: GNAT family N-acetyltransferase [Flavobacteriales bacterium]|nr:GNAT family N-acetyltransferase [Flavobacteriales bacterium]